VSGLLTRRAWRSGRRLWKLGGGALAGLVTVACGALCVLALRGYWKLNRTFDNPVANVVVTPTPYHLARGERLVGMCASCHAADGAAPLEGSNFLESGSPPIGRFYAPNLTPAHLGEWTDGEIIRAVREGISRNGRSLLIMPSEVFRNMSDFDVESVVAFLRSQPSVEPDTPAPQLNVLGAVLANFAPIFSAQPPVADPVAGAPPSETAEYGRYVASLACTLCHGDDLQGSTEDGVPDLSVAARTWSREEFASFFATGRRPAGDRVDGSRMPWREMREFMGDEGLSALILHLREEFPRADSTEREASRG
jgi:mono/diheme cytochrome c family protein